MSFDAARKFVVTKDAYARTRGARSGTGLYPETKTIPKTTYGDVITFAVLFSSAVSIEGCLKRLAKTYAVEAKRRNTCGPRSEYGYLDPCIEGDWLRLWGSGSKTSCYFQKTTSYKNALNAWFATWPFKKDPTGWALKMNQEYPWNEQFWTMGLRFAIARNAAGVVPGKFEIAMESINEAIDEAPELIKNTLKSVADALPGMPDVGPWAQLIKWGSIGGGLAILYYYVLKPKKKKLAQ